MRLALINHGEDQNDIRLIPNRKMRLSLATHTQLRNIFAAERLSDIPELHRFRILGLLIRVRSRVNGEDLVVA